MLSVNSNFDKIHKKLEQVENNATDHIIRNLGELKRLGVNLRQNIDIYNKELECCIQKLYNKK